MPTWNQCFTDDFHRANSATVGRNWLADGPSFSIVGDQLANSGAETYSNPGATDTAILLRPYVAGAVPAVVVPGMNESSLNQQFKIRLNQTRLANVVVLLRAKSDVTGYGFMVGYGGTTFYLCSGPGYSFVANGTYSPGAANGTSGFDELEITGSVVSANSTSTTTTITFTIVNLTTGATVYSYTGTDTTASLQPAALASTGCSYALTSFSAACVYEEVTFYTDQPVQAAASPLVGPTLSATSTPTSVTITETAPATGGTAPYVSQWLRSTSAPSGGNYGKLLLDQTSTGLADTGTRSGTTYWYTRRTTDQSANSQVVYTTLGLTTAAAVAVTPSSRSSLLLWADASALTGQTDGSPLVGDWSQFGIGQQPSNLTLGLPTYAAAPAEMSGKPALRFGGASTLRLNQGIDTEVDEAINGGSFTVGILYNPDATTGNQMLVASSPTTQNTRLFVELINAVARNADGSNPTLPGVGHDQSGQAYGLVPGRACYFGFAYDRPSNTATICSYDGSIVTYTPPTQITTYFPYTIGAGADNESPFTGYISNVTIDNVALTASQMRADMAFYRTRYASTNVKYIGLGDSRTYGYDTSSNPTAATYKPYTQFLAAMLSGVECISVGQIGAGTEQWLPGSSDYYPIFINAINPVWDGTVVVGILLGVNDADLAGLTPAQSVGNLVTIFGVVEAIPYVKSLTFSEMDCGADNWESAWRPTFNTDLAAALPPIPGKRGFVDLASDAILGVNGSAVAGSTAAPPAGPNQYWGNDHLHPTGEDAAGNIGGGYRVMAQAIVAHVNALLIGATIVPGSITDTNTGSALLSVTPTGASNYTYQWFQSSTSGVKGNAVSGATSSSYTAANLTLGTTYYFTCTVGDAGGDTPIDSAQKAVTIGVSGIVPSAGDVRYGVAAGTGTGTCHVPTASQTLWGVAVDASTGNVVQPAANTVISTASFGPNSATTGTVVIPATTVVEDGEPYGPDSSLIGTYSGGGSGSGITLDQLETALASGITTLAASGLDRVPVEAGINARQALSPILAACAGVVSGAGTGTVAIKGGSSSITRIEATTDDPGNRTSVTLNVPA